MATLSASPAACSTAARSLSLCEIDIHGEVPRVEYEKLTDERLGKPSADIRARIEKARDTQRQRFAGILSGAKGNARLLTNADMGPAEVREYCKLDDAGKSLPLGPSIGLAGVRSAPQSGAQAAMQQLGMSARAFHRTA